MRDAISDLPPGWTRVTLAQGAAPRGEKASPADHPTAPFIGMDHVEAHSGRVIGSVPAASMKSAAARFYAGDVLYGRLRPYLNKVTVPCFDGLASAEFIVFPDTAFLSSAFFAYRLRAADFVNFASHLNEGDRPRVDFVQIGAFSLDVPPLHEQHRIVAKIEALFSELDKADESLTLARAQLKTYRQALLDTAMDGRLLVGMGRRKEPFSSSDRRSLSAIILEIGQGWSPQCHNYPADGDEAWAVMKTTAIQHLAFNDRENKALTDNLRPRSHLELRPGDLLITRAGPRARVGVACLVRQVRPRLLLCDKAYRLRVDKSIILPEYLELILNAPRVLWEIEQIKTGISDSGLNLTQSKFLTLQVPIPTIQEQLQTLTDVSGALSYVDKLELEIEAGVSKTNALRQSILKQAFSGRLVPQDPADEPAAALLARLCEQPPPARTRRRKTA